MKNLNWELHFFFFFLVFSYDFSAIKQRDNVLKHYSEVDGLMYTDLSLFVFFFTFLKVLASSGSFW